MSFNKQYCWLSCDTHTHTQHLVQVFTTAASSIRVYLDDSAFWFGILSHQGSFCFWWRLSTDQALHSANVLWLKFCSDVTNYVKLKLKLRKRICLGIKLWNVAEICCLVSEQWLWIIRCPVVWVLAASTTVIQNKPTNFCSSKLFSGECCIV